MTSKRFEAIQRGIRFPEAYTGEDEIGVHWNGRHGVGAALEITAWPGHEGRSIGTFRISLGDFLRALELTAEDCTAAIEATHAAESEGA